MKQLFYLFSLLLLENNYQSNKSFLIFFKKNNIPREIIKTFPKDIQKEIKDKINSNKYQGALKEINKYKKYANKKEHTF